MTSDALVSGDLVERWRSLIGAYSRVRDALDSALEREHGLSGCELDVLQWINDAGDGIRIQDLCERVDRSQGAISRMVGRLEDEQLVARSIYRGDRRGIVVQLSDAGRDRLRAAEVTQRRVLAQTLPTSGPS